MQAFVARNGDDVVLQAPFVGLEREGLIDSFEELCDCVLLLRVADGPEGVDGRELVTLDTQAEAHFGV